MNAVSIAPSTITCPTWMFCGPSSRAIACASARSACFAPAERREPRAAPHAGGGAGEQDRAAPALHHASRHGLRREKPAEARQLPDLQVLARGLLQHAARHVGAHVEDEHLDGADGRVSISSTSAATSSSRRASEPKPCASPPSARICSSSGCSFSALRRVTQATYAFAREPPRDGAARAVAGADDQRDSLSVRGVASGLVPSWVILSFLPFLTPPPPARTASSPSCRPSGTPRRRRRRRPRRPAPAPTFGNCASPRCVVCRAAACRCAC